MRRRVLGAVLVAAATLLLALGGEAAAPARADESRLAQADARWAVPDLAQPGRPASYGPAEWMRIPRIGVDSNVADVGVEGAEYGVPWFAVGHHADSANPGERGNSVFNGHVLTIHAGRVFERLHELQPGDAVYVYTPTHRTDWVVETVFAVSDGDNSFIQPTSDTRISLYTCTGTFNPLEQNYSERLVVVGRLVQAVPRG